MTTKSTRRVLLQRGMLLIGAMSLAQACAPAAAPTPAAPKPADASKPAAAAPAAKVSGTITYWDFVTPGDNSPRGQALANNVKAFEAANPDVKVNVEVVPPAQITTQLIQGAASKKTPDVIRVYSFFLETHVNAGSIEPLDAYVGSWDKSDWLVDWSQSVYDGKKMAIPYEYRVSLLLYRKSLLEAKGVEVPTTWDEILAGAKKIGADNPMGFAVGLSKADNANVLAECFVDGVLAGGGKIFNDDGTAAFNGEAGVRTFKFIDDLFKEKGTSQAALNFTYDSVTDGLKSGTIAMGILGSHRVSAIRAGGAKEDLAFSGIPGWEKGKPGPSNPMGFFLTLGKYAPNKDAAMKYIDFMTGPRVAVELAKGGEIPPRKSSYQDPFFSTPAAAEVSRFKELFESRPGAVRYPEKFPEFEDLLADAAQQMVLQNRPPKEVLDAAAQKYNGLIKR